MRTSIVATLACLIFVCVPATHADAAGPPPELVHCGQLIDHSLRVVNDLSNCPGPGLNVTSDGVVLDLGGHRIDGRDDLYDGVLINGSQVTVRNGTVSDFRYGVGMFAADRSSIVDVSSYSNETGFYFNSSTNPLLRNVDAVDNRDDGISIVGAIGMRIIGSVASRNTYGINGVSLATDLSDTLIRGSRVELNTGAGIVLRAVNDHSVARTALRSNHVRYNAVDGIKIVGATDTSVVSNESGANGGSGIVFDSTGGAISSNRAIGNGRAGIDANASSFVRISGNVASRNNENGIVIEGGTANGVVRSNRAATNGISGIVVTADSTGSQLDANTANENGSSGISVASAATTIRRNVANSNGFLNGVIDGAGLGIEAPSGTTNSRNKARQNDDRRECVESDLNCHRAVS